MFIETKTSFFVTRELVFALSTASYKDAEFDIMAEINKMKGFTEHILSFFFFL